MKRPYLALGSALWSNLDDGLISSLLKFSRLSRDGVSKTRIEYVLLGNDLS